MSHLTSLCPTVSCSKNGSSLGWHKGKMRECTGSTEHNAGSASSHQIRSLMVSPLHMSSSLENREEWQRHPEAECSSPQEGGLRGFWGAWEEAWLRVGGLDRRASPSQPRQQTSYFLSPSLPHLLQEAFTDLSFSILRYLDFYGPQTCLFISCLRYLGPCYKFRLLEVASFLSQNL